MPNNDSETAGSLPLLTVLRDKAGPHTIGAVNFTLGLSFNQATEALHRIETWPQVVEALKVALDELNGHDCRQNVCDMVDAALAAAERKG